MANYNFTSNTEIKKMEVQIVTTYIASVPTKVKLPEGKTWDDIDSWNVKWHTLYIVFNDGTEFSPELCNDSEIDWKHPNYVKVFDGNIEIDGDC